MLSQGAFRTGSVYSTDATLNITLSSDKDYTISNEVLCDLSQYQIGFTETTLGLLEEAGFALNADLGVELSGYRYVSNSDIKYSGNFHLNALSAADAAAVINGTKKELFYTTMDSIASEIYEGDLQMDCIYISAEYEWYGEYTDIFYTEDLVFDLHIELGERCGNNDAKGKRRCQFQGIYCFCQESF